MCWNFLIEIFSASKRQKKLDGPKKKHKITQETTPITIPQKLSRPIRDFFLTTFNIKEKKQSRMD